MAESRKRIVLAQPRGYCAGVRRAIAIVERALEIHGRPVYVRKQIVHNHYVVRQLENLGALFVESESDVPEGAICVFSAHGVAPDVRDNAEQRGLDVIDATCPLVAKVHQEARRSARDGRTIVLVGHANHEEVQGTFGVAPERTHIVETLSDAAELDLPRDAPLTFLTQTTLALDETADIVAELRRRFDALDGPGTDDICYASQNRQNAVKSLASQCDLVLVVGSANSSNSVRMVEVARTAGTRAFLVPEAGCLDESWLDGVVAVGVSSGASAPEILVEQLIDRLAELGYIDVELHSVATEDVVFHVPARLA
jgi:4-hydroxy-3-methylbut-2-enyl diphosphate reductase